MGRAAVVILNWNGERLLSRYLPTVVGHTPLDIDIVVVDNNSTDGSIALLKDEFAGRVSIITHDRNYGFAEGYNRALALLDRLFHSSQL